MIVSWISILTLYNHSKLHISHSTHSFKPRIYFPKFGRDNPRLWLCKCVKYINFHPMNDYDKLLMAEINMEEESDNWYLDYVDGIEEIRWD